MSHSLGIYIEVSRAFAMKDKTFHEPFTNINGDRRYVKHIELEE